MSSYGKGDNAPDSRGPVVAPNLGEYERAIFKAFERGKKNGLREALKIVDVCRDETAAYIANVIRERFHPERED